MYSVALAEFAGPLDLLLQLIEGQKMDITRVSLTAVANQYIDYINSAPAIHPEEMADFLVVASRLIYIKSKALLPTLDLESDGVDLEKQLKMYKVFLDASKALEKQIGKGAFLYRKTAYPPMVEEGFSPPVGVSTEKCARVYEQIIRRLKPLLVLPKKLIQKTVTISEKIEHIKQIILKYASVRFCDIVKESHNRTEKIVSFLAMLELVKQKAVHVTQEELFHDIHITKR